MEKQHYDQSFYSRKPKHWMFSLILAAVLVFTSSVQSLVAAESPTPTAFEVVDAPEGISEFTVQLPDKSVKSENIKIDSGLTALIQSGENFATVAAEKSIVMLEDRVQVQVTINPEQKDQAAALIKQSGGAITGVSNDQSKFQAWLPLSSLDFVAANDAVYQIRQPLAPVLFEEVNVGSLTTEALPIINGNAWHTAGHTGEGVKVAIIDGGFEGYPSLLGSDLPASVTIKNFVDFESDSYVNGTTDHGTACAEIIHDLAPDAELYLIKIGTDLDLEEAVNWLITYHDVDIISTSLGWYNATPGDGTGVFAELVEQAKDAGILWITAAGNDRDAHWGGAFNDLNQDGIHDYNADQFVNYFGPGNGQVYAINAGYVFSVFLRWDDWTNVNQDFNLYLLRYGSLGWEIISGSTNIQDGSPGQTPTEYAYAVTTGDPAYYGFLIYSYDSDRAVNFEIFAPEFLPLDKVVFSRSLANLADAPEAMTVAALDVTSPFPQESYSSEGPTNGPGGTAAGGFTKPDIAGFANVSTVSYGTTPGYQFNGTSSATPHVAGAAALILSAFPYYNPNQIQSYLETHAVDMGPAGMDSAFGYGRLDLGAVPYSGIHVFNITPNMVENDGVISTTIYGANFASGATVKLTRVGQVPVNATNIVITNGNKITCNFDVDGIAFGKWDLTVTNPDTSSTTLTNGMIVVNQLNNIYAPLIIRN